MGWVLMQYAIGGVVAVVACHNELWWSSPLLYAHAVLHLSHTSSCYPSCFALQHLLPLCIAFFVPRCTAFYCFVLPHRASSPHARTAAWSYLATGAYCLYCLAYVTLVSHMLLIRTCCSLWHHGASEVEGCLGQLAP